MFAKPTANPVLIAALSLAAAAGSALAQGVNNPGSLPMNFQTTAPPTGWLVVDPSGGPVPVSLNPGPNAQPWSKNFTGPNGQNFSYPAGSNPLPVTEILQVAPTLPWTDWHEEVATPGWVWATQPFVQVNNVPIFPTINGVGTNQLDFYFSPPLNVGDQVIIRKDLAFPGTPGATFIGTLAIHEFPTPEPASLLLLVGGTALLKKRRRHA